MKPNPTYAKEVLNPRDLREQLEEDFRGLQSDYNNAGHTIPDSYLNSFLEGGYRGAELMKQHIEPRPDTGRDIDSIVRRSVELCVEEFCGPEGKGWDFKESPKKILAQIKEERKE